VTIVKEKELTGYIDHTLLKATVTSGQIEQLCAEAREYGFCAVSVNPRWVSLAADQLHGSKVKVGGVGGIRTARQVIEFLEAGADRIGTSSGVQIINEFRAGQIK